MRVCESFPEMSRVHNKKSLKSVRRFLRNSLTPAEAVLWKNLQRSQLAGKKFLIWDDRHRSHGIAGGNDEDLSIEDVTYFGKGAGAMFSIAGARGTTIFRRCIARSICGSC